MVVLVFVKNDFSDNSAVIQAINHGLDPAHMPKLFARRQQSKFYRWIEETLGASACSWGAGGTVRVRSAYGSDRVLHYAHLIAERPEYAGLMSGLGSGQYSRDGRSLFR